MFIEKDYVEQCLSRFFYRIKSVVGTFHEITFFFQKEYIGSKEIDLVVYPKKTCFVHLGYHPVPLLKEIGQMYLFPLYLTIFFAFLGEFSTTAPRLSLILR